jgi:hypothetical protein
LWIVQRYGFEPALAGALGDSFGVALVLAMMMIAKAQPAEGWALAAGAIFLLVPAFGCVGDGHWFPALLLSATLPPLFVSYSESGGFAGFWRHNIRDKGFSSSSHVTRRMEPDLFFRARFMMSKFAGVRKERCHMVGVEKLRFVLAAR